MKLGNTDREIALIYNLTSILQTLKFFKTDENSEGVAGQTMETKEQQTQQPAIVMWLDQQYFHNRTKKYNILELNTHESFSF